MAPGARKKAEEMMFAALLLHFRPHRAVSLQILVLCLAVGVTLGCAGNPTATDDSRPTIASPAPTAIPATVATRFSTATVSPTATPSSKAAADFAFMLFQGEHVLGASELRLSDLSGRPIVLNFWARLCGPCWKEMPDLQDFYEEHGDRVGLIGIDIGQFTGLGSPKDARKLLEALGISYPAGFTDDASVVPKFSVRAMPTTVFIDSKGAIFRTWTGAIERHELERITAELLELEREVD